ncbi:DUF2232 domain-containing protein [Melghirimyces algeriensis]|uniref:Uncharacterized conserved protein YybS, DUF2232 family n=1 Tax=Melghirimyces algeriensis TaxID=910412 RepID=A0A521DAA2_9BACL|nr:DUF2232 domain-containing protein [Melghirimyces algeriensis]SMO68593.1 Uncharacterized conserved protein YybS, DUF2232 family [Melghirimyces algeriensis]
MFRISDIRDGIITVLLFLLITFSLITPLSLLTVWFLPLPFFLHTSKNGWLSALFPMGLGALLLWVLTGQPLNVMVIFLVAATGMIMGGLYREDSSTGTDVVLGGLTAVWAGSLLLLTVMVLFLDITDQMSALFQQEWERNQEIFQAYGLNEPLPEWSSMMTVVPGMLLLMIAPVPLLNLIVGRRWLVKQGFPKKYLPPFRKWHLPRSFFYFYFFVLLVFLIFGMNDNHQVLALSNIVVILFVFFLIQGFSFISLLLKRYNRGRGWMISVIALTIFIPFATMVVHFLGILDTGTRIRSRFQGEE